MNIVKNRYKKMAAVFLTFIMLSLFIYDATLEAADGTAEVSLTNLGTLGNVSIGSKEKGSNENWWQMKLATDSNTVQAFCMNLGYACHTGDKYKRGTAVTVSTDDSNTENALYAHIAYFWNEISSQGKRAYQMTQALIWAVEEGYTSKSQLTGVIQDVIDSGYSTSKTAGEWYEKVLMGTESTATIYFWNYTGSGSSRQQLLEIVSSEIIIEPSYKSYSTHTNYRQRIKINKVDEDGTPIADVKFNISAKNLDELYSFAYSDKNGSESDSADDLEEFEKTFTTSSKGNISLRLTYRLQSEDYYYIPDDELVAATSAQIAQIKAELDEKNYSYGESLTKEEAVSLAEKDLEKQFAKISNKYVITEIAAGDNYVLDSRYATGKTVTLKTENSWLQNLDKYPDYSGWEDAYYGASTGDSASNYEKVVKYVITNEFKKVTVPVIKTDVDTTYAQGNASLEGAVYGLYSDSSCMDLFGKYTTDSERSFEIDNLRCGTTYYLKEISASPGYMLNETVYKLEYNGADYTDAVNTAPEYTVTDTVIKGKIAIIKGMTNGIVSEIVKPEQNAVFEIYLASAGSYDNAADSEKDLLITDEEGFGQTKSLPYGTYIVHQTDTDNNTEAVADFAVTISEDGKIYRYILNNKPFGARIRITKIDGNTGQTVLKENTQYQIYSYDSDTDTETLITQTYSDGNKVTSTSTWTTDKSGIIVTYNVLSAGIYHIYEVNAAQGYSKNSDYIRIEITDTSYTVEYDENGIAYYFADAVYTNMETYGQLGIVKYGEILSEFTSSFSDGFLNTVSTSNSTESGFIYENIPLTGAVFEIYAAEDIYTQDNQGTIWFGEDELAATVTTGEGAAFTSECGGITSYVIDEKSGQITINLPLGRYTIKEVSTPYGYVINDNNTWTVEFVWGSQEDVYVYDSYSEKATDENGVLCVCNALAKGSASITKTDSVSENAVEGAVFGVYTKDTIYSYNGSIVSEADSLLDIVTTDENGYAATNIYLPLTAEGYGDYYFMEISVSDSYYVNPEKKYFSLVYTDMNTAVVCGQAQLTDKQTTVSIDKLSLVDGKNVEGASLEITDNAGNVIASWITGNEKSISIYNDIEALGYKNFDVTMSEDGNVKIYGLFHGHEYTLTEIRPADGYVTADSITFMLTESADSTKVLLKSEEGEYTETGTDNIVMYDDITKLKIVKLAGDTNEQLKGCKITVLAEDGGEVLNFTTSEEAYYVEMLPIGTYILHEAEPVAGYEAAEDIVFEVQDTGEDQTVVMTDNAAITTPKTGGNGGELWRKYIGAIIAVSAGYILFLRYMKKYICIIKKESNVTDGRINEQ